MYTRLSKISILLIYGLMMLIVALNNIFDYYCNFAFVEHVLEMDSIFPENPLQGRDIHSGFLQHGFYILIIIAEFTTAVFAIYGSWKLWTTIKEANLFHSAKKFGIMAFILGLFIFYLGFMTIGGEWFVSWQSSSWSSSDSGEVKTILIIVSLIYFTRKDLTEDA